MGELWLQNEVNWRSYIEEMNSTENRLRYENDEIFAAEVDARMRWFAEQGDLYAVEVEKHNAAIDRSYETTTLGVITGTTSMAEANDRYKENHLGLTDQLKINHDEFQAKA
jgi:hypothetical protein